MAKGWVEKLLAYPIETGGTDPETGAVVRAQDVPRSELNLSSSQGIVNWVARVFRERVRDARDAGEVFVFDTREARDALKDLILKEKDTVSLGVQDPNDINEYFVREAWDYVENNGLPSTFVMVFCSEKPRIPDAIYLMSAREDKDTTQFSVFYAKFDLFRGKEVLKISMATVYGTQMGATHDKFGVPICEDHISRAAGLFLKRRALLSGLYAEYVDVTPVEREGLHPSVQHKRAKKGKPPLLEHKRVTLKVGPQEIERVLREAREGADEPAFRKRQHPVLGHWRTLRRGTLNEKRVWVTGHLRGDPALGRITRENRVVLAAHD